MNIAGKTIAITGGGNGIGRELVFELVRQGAQVAIIDIKQEYLDETLEMIGPEKNKSCSTHQVDITDKERVERLPKEIIEFHGQIDGIINNAGIIQPFVRVNDLDYPTIERVFNCNFFGTLHMIKAFLPYLLDRPEAHIVNVSSMGGFLPVPGQSIYGASKAGVKLMSEGLQQELVETNVKVSVVFPGSISTNIVENSGVESPINNSKDIKTEDFKPLPADVAAKEIVRGIEKNKIRIFVGKDSKMMNKLYRLSPGYATKLIGKNMKALLS